MSDYRAVRIVSTQATAPPRAPHPPVQRPSEHSYALIVALLTLVTTAVAFYDLYLLATSQG